MKVLELLGTTLQFVSIYDYCWGSVGSTVFKSQHNRVELHTAKE